LETRGVLNNGKQINYALGLFVTQYRGLPVVEHGGALFGYRTELMRFPEQRFSVVCLCNLNSANPGAKARQIADLYLEGKFPPASNPRPGAIPAGGDRQPASTISASDLTRWSGLYRDPKERSFIAVSSREGGLEIRNPLVDPVSPNEAPAVLKPDANYRFQDPHGPGYRFDPTTASGGAGGGLTVLSGNGVEHKLERIEPTGPTASELAQYSGDYFSEELSATYRLRSTGDGRLLVTVGWNPPIELRPSIHDEFFGRLAGEFREPIVVGFVRDGDRIVGFDLFAGFADGVREIRFSRK
jgi:hypothetical protein